MPKIAKEALLKEGWGSAEGSIKHRERVSRGRREERFRRACRAESLAEETATEGGGDGRAERSISGVSSEVSFEVDNDEDVSSGSCCLRRVAAEDWRREVNLGERE